MKHNLNVMVCSNDLKYYGISHSDVGVFFWDVWSLQLLINSPVFHYKIYGFSAE